MSDDQSKSGLDKAIEALRRARQTKAEVESLRPASKAVTADAIRQKRLNGLSDLMVQSMASRGA